MSATSAHPVTGVADEAPLRWGVLGTGSIAATVSDAAAGLGHARFSAVASRDAGRAGAFADEHGVPASCGSYEELLARDDVDAVYVALPIALHVDWAVAALGAGKHVLCEKPLAMDGTSAQRAVDAARAAGCQLLEGFMWRHHPQTLLAQRLVAEGAVGEVTTVRAALSVSVPPGDIRRSEHLGGGAHLDLGCYCVSAVRMFGGEVTEVTAQSVMDGDSDVVDLRTTALLRTERRVLGHFDVGLDLPRRDQLEVVGTAGVLTVPDPWLCRTGSLTVQRDGYVEHVAVDPEGVHRLTGQEADAYRAEIAAVSAQLVGGQVETDRELAWVLAQAAALQAVRAAARGGGPAAPTL